MVDAVHVMESIQVGNTAKAGDCVQCARKGLTIYFVVLIVLTALLEWRLVSYGDPIGNHLPVVILLMWSPAIASFVARIIRREGLGDVSFRLPEKSARNTLWIAWLFTVVVASIAYGIAWLTGLVSFSPVHPRVLGLATAPSAVGFTGYLVIELFLGVLVSIPLVAGEEIGWRGYMLTRLVDGKIPWPVLLSALIWGLWHLPLILSGIYTTGSNRLLSAGLSLVTVIPLGYLIAWLRLRSGSIWPAILCHASWNTVIETVFDRATAGNNIWVGETGLLVALATLVLVVLLLRGRPELDERFTPFHHKPA
jgi:membrane protease YdiL (CAAX protease family)